MPAIPVISALGTVGGVALQAKGMSDARKAANAATNAAAPTVDINALDAQAREFARRNAIEGAALENELNPELGQLRTQSILSLINSLARSPQADTIANRIGATAGQDISAPLLRDAIRVAQEDLAQGGALPLDVRNLVARNAFARAGTGGSLGLARDILPRDLGLTSLELRNRRLQNAATLGGAEADLSKAARADLFASGEFLRAIQEGDFARALSASALGQNIALPETGLDPSAVANLAVGNTNALAQKQQQDAAVRMAAANQLGQLGGQLTGAGLGYFANRNPSSVSYGPTGAPATGGSYYPPWFTPPKG